MQQCHCLQQRCHLQHMPSSVGLEHDDTRVQHLQLAGLDLPGVGPMQIIDMTAFMNSLSNAGVDSAAMVVTAIKGLPPQQQLVLVAAVRLLGEKPAPGLAGMGSPTSQAGTLSAHKPLGQLQTATTPSTSARKPPTVRLCDPLVICLPLSPPSRPCSGIPKCETAHAHLIFGAPVLQADFHMGFAGEPVGCCAMLNHERHVSGFLMLLLSHKRLLLTLHQSRAQVRHWRQTY